MSLRVCVIGAGASGLPTIKTCLTEGLQLVCYERTDNIGGLWNYSTEVKEGRSSVMKNTYTNTSKEHLCYSDYPFPEDYPNFFHNRKMMDYFQAYAKEFDLMGHITFNTEVVQVTKHRSYEQTGQWSVESRDLKNNTTKTEVFDGVLVCTGHHAYPNMPNFPGENDFKGKILHSHAYKDQWGLEDKRVLVVGIGNSGGDIAAELSHISNQVYLSIRKGAWIQSKVEPQGLPWDVGLTRRRELSNWWNGEKKINAILEAGGNIFLDTLNPEHMLLGMYSICPTANEDLITRLIDGSVKMKTNVKKILVDSVVFDDDSVVENIDVIIYATGYQITIPCVNKKVINTDADNKVNLYKYVFPPDLPKPTLAVIGCIQPWGPVFPAAEMMGRVATRVIKGVCKLPEREVMWNDIKARHEWIAKIYNNPSSRHTIEVGYVTIMDELADMIRCKPNYCKLFFTDHSLFKEIYYGPCTSAQYRLEGPDKWAGARDKIITQWQRIIKPMQYRKLDEAKAAGGGRGFTTAVAVLAAMGAVGYYFYTT